MGAVGDLVVRLLGDTKQLDDSIRKSEKNLRKFGESAAKIGRKLTTFVTLPILAIGAAFVKTAGDAEETNQKFNVVFREQADAVRQWAKEFGDATGRSTIETVKFLASVQDLFVPLGIAREEATDLSKSVVTLATDMASFNNVPTDRVLLDIQSALVGSVITMRKYGVVLNQTNLKQELLNMGIEGSITEATAAQKALARYNIILRGTSDAQGDAVRTADSFVNRFIALKSSIIDLAQSFGNIMIPVVQKVIEGLTKASQYIEDLDEGQKKLIIRIALLVAAIGPLLLIVSKSITLFIALRKVMLAARTAVLLMNAAMTANPYVAFAVVVTALVAAVALLVVAKGDLNELSTKEKELDEDIIKLKKELTTARISERVAILNTLLAKAAERVATLEALKAEDELRAKMQRSSPFFNQFLADTNQKLAEAKTGYFELQQQVSAVNSEYFVFLAQQRSAAEALKDGTEATKDGTEATKDDTEAEKQRGIMIVNLWGWKQKWLRILAASLEVEKKAIEIVKDGNDWKQAQIDLAGEYLFKQRTITEEGKEANRAFWAPYIELLEKAAAAYRIELIPTLETMVDKLRALNHANWELKSAVEVEIEAEKERQETLKETERILTQVGNAMVSTTIGITSSLATIWGNYYTGLLENEELTDEERKKLQHDAAIRQRDLALFGAIVSGAQAVVNALLTKPFFPVGLAMGALASVLAGFQIAAIASTPIPALAEGGIITEPTVILAGEAGPEVIAPLDSMPMRVTVNLGSKVLYDEISQGTRDRNILIDRGAIA